MKSRLPFRGLLDLGEYVISAMGWEPPSRYSDIGPILAAHGVLESSEGEVLARLARLRNVLMHAYADVDYGLLLEHARRLRSDARRILRKLVGFMEGSGLDP